MGGYGSGRSGGRPTIEGCASYSLNINRLVRVGLQYNMIGFVTWRYSDGFEVKIQIDTTSEWQPHLMLEHIPYSGDSDEPISYRVGLQTTRPPYGGIRWWFVCPRDQERCGKLFLPNGGRQFWGRKAYRLKYQSQQESEMDRAARRALNALRRIGGGGGPHRPKWMRHKTYERLYNKWLDAETLSNELFVYRACRILGLEL